MSNRIRKRWIRYCRSIEPAKINAAEAMRPARTGPKVHANACTSVLSCTWREQYHWRVKFLFGIFYLCPPCSRKFRFGILTPKWENRGEITPLVQSFKVPGWYPALCRMPPRHFGTLHQWCVKFVNRIFYLFWRPYGRKFRFGIFDRDATRNCFKKCEEIGEKLGSNFTESIKP